jgi:hypothetical protein
MPSFVLEALLSEAAAANDGAGSSGGGSGRGSMSGAAAAAVSELVQCLVQLDALDDAKVTLHCHLSGFVMSRPGEACQASSSSAFRQVLCFAA